MRKILSLLLVLCLVLSAVPVYAGAADGQRVSASIATVTAGNTAIVTLKAENFAAIAALDVYVYYDASVFTVSSTTNGSLLSSAQVSVNTGEAGKITLSTMALNGISGTGTLLTLNFATTADCTPGTYPITVAIGRAYDTGLLPATVGGLSGNITVNAPVPTETFSIYGYPSATTLCKGDMLSYRVASGSSARSFVSGEFTVTYDHELFAVEDVSLEDDLATDTALYSINTSALGQVRIAYANEMPVKNFYLFTVKLRVIGDIDGTTTLKATANNMYREDLFGYLPGSYSNTITLNKLPEVADHPNAFLELDTAVLGKQNESLFCLEAGAGVAAADFQLTYDPAVLRCVAVTAAEDVAEKGGMVVVNDNFTSGSIRFSYVNASAYAESVLPLVRITWEPIKDSHYTIAPAVDGVYDGNLEPVELECITASGCVYTAAVTAPTCQTPGFTRYTCTCGQYFDGDFVDALGHDMVGELCFRCQKVRTGEGYYPTLAESMAAADGQYLQLNFSFAEEVQVNVDMWLDLNGCTLTGDITIADGATLYLFDSATADYTAENRGKVKGSITGNLARGFNTPETYGHNYKYMVIQEDDGSWSAHRYYLAVKSAILNPLRTVDGVAETTLSYKTVLICNETVIPYITAFGAKFDGDKTVYVDHLQRLEALQPGAVNACTTQLAGTLRSTNTETQNAANALAAPAVSGYITLVDGVILESAAVRYSLRDAVIAANDARDLDRVTCAFLGEMYTQFQNVFDAWVDISLENLKKYA